ncbi:TetR/AcrR family transcriptional regulator [Silvibacterium dinghuense]|uniref:TetR/AcrR family transcriptional regulator n=1 Tax=Silvibacterium dinghuense TaxID=1560006 RepID=A0A4V1NUS4_9BACT|nr:TetR/AcrR family transcriptional regulator [Silvibacterium dinghuense]RXS93248.1 TetR/AcrR family transcriptional regulator [Silvibacterium dinghuense]GGH04299.1 TetR family transcriptional regulator [Silvibacterium dinghuense]
MKSKVVPAATPVRGVKEAILDTACALFYEQGVRAVGVDLIVEKAGVAKTSLYRFFGTKDELVAAFLRREDEDFWGTWERVARQHMDQPAAELKAQLKWIGERVGRSNYRGCPQINVAAEFPEADHPARKVAAAHKREMRKRLKSIAERLGVARPDQLAGQLSLLINGAFVSSAIFKPGEGISLLLRTGDALVHAARE